MLEAADIREAVRQSEARSTAEIASVALEAEAGPDVPRLVVVAELPGS
jgi:hypothetical protein